MVSPKFTALRRNIQVQVWWDRYDDLANEQQSTTETKNQEEDDMYMGAVPPSEIHRYTRVIRVIASPLMTFDDLQKPANWKLWKTITATVLNHYQKIKRPMERDGFSKRNTALTASLN